MNEAGDAPEKLECYNEDGEYYDCLDGADEADFPGFDSEFCNLIEEEEEEEMMFA